MRLLFILPLIVALVAMLVAFVLTHRRTKKRDTEIRVLTKEFKDKVQQTCAAAHAGDPAAAKAVEELKETITEQSIRWTGRPKPPTTVIKGGIV